ncbi:MAG: aspartate/glutamate racemase family protein [Stomatobaculum sp.]|nr:aspartate/glutamate racemase family protein [Stomatobaculum sp.]
MTGALGILMLDTHIPRIKGDIGNPESFSFPVRKLTIRGASPERVVLEADPSLLEPFLQGAEQLEREGCAAITTSCGFLAMFQKEMAARVKIPVFTSSLLQVRTAYGLLPAGKIVGILTADGERLGERHFRGAGIEDVPKVVCGMEGTHFHEVFIGGREDLDRKKAGKELLERALRMTKDHPEIGAIVCECTNMPPYTEELRRVLDCPVYDILTLAEYIMQSVR